MTLVRIEVRPRPGRADAVSAALFGAGAEALQETEGALVTIVPAGAGAQLTAAAIAADSGATVTTAEAPDVDWTAVWRTQLRAHTVGVLTVTPPWLAMPFLPGHRIVIEPAMAFGTGDHATTRGVLKLMQDDVRRGDVVADLGTGSAVLAIAAARLGAARVIGFDDDPDAVRNAEENVAVNDAGAVVTIIEGDARLLLPLVGPVRVVLANIVSPVLREMTAAIIGSLTPDGVAIFSGMLVTERDDMRAWFTAAGLRAGGDVVEGEWWSAAWHR